jgi:hypothetical protein
MKILCAPTAIARTRPLVCHELAGVDVTAPAVAGHTASSTNATTITRADLTVDDKLPRSPQE